MPKLSEQIIPKRKLLLMGSETLLIAAILLLGTSLPPLARNDVSLSPLGPDLWSGLRSSLLVALLAQASLSFHDLYDWKVSQNRAELPHRLLYAAGYTLVMLAAGIYVAPFLFAFPGLANTTRQTWAVILLLASAFAALWAWRVGFHWFFYRWNFGERVLILGSGPQARFVANLVRDNPFSGFELVGLVRGPGDPELTPAENLALPEGEQVVGECAELAQLAIAHRAARIVVALEERRGTLPVSALLDCKMAGLMIEEKEAMYERIAGKIAVQSLRPSYLIFGAGFRRHPVAGAAKRVIDVVVSLVGLALSIPICAVVAVLIKLDSRGPLFFSQERVGQNGRLFRVIKFRTMTADAEKLSGAVWAQKHDPRVTRVGRVLRLSRIDEIPQMVNVLAGHMSFVGPRPERPVFVDQLSEQIRYYPLRHTVKPGLTGWAQVNYPYGASVEDAEEKLRYDLYYVKNMNPLFDLNIILRTVGVILFGKGAR